MQLRYSYRLYPLPEQQQALARAFGCARVVCNDALAARREAHEAGKPYISDAAMSARLTAAKNTSQRAWLGEVSSVVLQQALADLNTAHRNFFNSVTGKRKGPKIAPPRFRSGKDSRQAIRFTRNSRFRVLDNGRLRLPKIGDVHVRWSRPLPAEPSSVTVIRDAAGPVLRLVRCRDGPGITAGDGSRVRDRPWSLPLRGAGRRHQDNRATLLAPGGEEAKAGAEKPVPQAEGQQE